MRKMLRVLLSGGLLAMLGLGLSGLDAPAYASADRCPGATPPLCRSVKSCTDWAFCGGGPSGVNRCCSTEETNLYYFADPA